MSKSKLTRSKLNSSKTSKKETQEEIQESDEYNVEDQAGSSCNYGSESCSLINGVDNLSCSSANSSIYVSSDDEDVPMREKRIWMITEQQRRTFRRMRRLEAETRERRLANRHTHKKRTNFGWMKTVGKYPVSWGKKWKPAT